MNEERCPFIERLSPQEWEIFVEVTAIETIKIANPSEEVVKSIMNKVMNVLIDEQGKNIHKHGEVLAALEALLDTIKHYHARNTIFTACKGCNKYAACIAEIDRRQTPTESTGMDDTDDEFCPVRVKAGAVIKDNPATDKREDETGGAIQPDDQSKPPGEGT